MSAAGLTGALLHVTAHALAKSALFCCAGSIILKTGYTRIEELRGIGRRMPVTTWAFALAGLSLVGIPPMAGFVSKWYLADAAMAGGFGVFSYLIPAILLLSALLTAGYLLGPVIDGFFPGKHFEAGERCETGALQYLPILVLVGAGLLLGIFGETVFGILQTVSTLAM
jgi:multicomponent Na+:H+ antiporter subunit D